MTLPRSAADVLARHVVFELECIDRVYCNLYVPKLQRDLGVVGFIREHLGRPVASTAVLAERTEAFYAEIKAFAGRNGIPVVDFRPGQRKDDVMREHLAAFLAAGRAEGVVFIGRAQEKVSVWATTRRRDAEGNSYPWIVRDSRVVTQWYLYCYDVGAGPFFLKYCGYFPYNAKLCCNGNEYAKAMAARAARQRGCQRAGPGVVSERLVGPADGQYLPGRSPAADPSPRRAPLGEPCAGPVRETGYVDLRAAVFGADPGHVHAVRRQPRRCRLRLVRGEPPGPASCDRRQPDVVGGDKSHQIVSDMGESQVSRRLHRSTAPCVSGSVTQVRRCTARLD